MKNLAIALLLLFCVNVVAQGHTFKECRLNKNWMKNTEGVSCPACNEKTKKEKTARVAEQKQRDIDHNKKVAANNLAKQKAFEAEQAKKRAEAAKPKSGEVVINAQPKPTGKSQPLKAKPVSNSPNRYLRISGYNHFLDAYTMEKIENTSGFNYKAFGGTYIEDHWNTIHSNFPANSGVVIALDEKVDQSNHRLYGNGSFANIQYNVMDIIVGEKQQRLFNSDSIAGIFHFYGDWFLIGTGFTKNIFGLQIYENAGLFNLSSKQFIAIDEKSYQDEVQIAAIKQEGIICRNTRFASGTYKDIYFPGGGDQSAPLKRRDAELFLDDKTGGPTQWKSMLSVRIRRHSGDKNPGYAIYYIDANDNIQELPLSSQEYDEFLAR